MNIRQIISIGFVLNSILYAQSVVAYEATYYSDNFE